MPAKITSEGQITIPKKVRDLLHLSPGDAVEFNVDQEGRVIVFKTGARRVNQKDRFASALGKAQVKRRTRDLMILLRGTD